MATPGTDFSLKEKMRGFLAQRIDAFKREFRKEYLEEKPSRIVRNLFLVVLGNIVLAFAASVFMIPAEVVSGGNSGIALIIVKFASMAGVQWDVNLIVTLLTIFFFILGLFIVGLDFTLKTAISTAVYPSFVYFFDWLRGLDGMSWMRVEAYTAEYGRPMVMLIAGMFGGLLMGIGVGLAFKGGGSTGGTDCLIIALNRHTPFKANTISIVMDTSIILLGLVAYQDLIATLIGVAGAALCAIMIGKLFVGSEDTFIATIISGKWEEISVAINKQLERGTTIYTAEGGYTGATRKVISVSFSKDEYRDLLRIVHKIDRMAFMTIASAHEVQGYGFTYDDADAIPQIKEKHSLKDIFKIQKKVEKAALETKEKGLKKDLDIVIKEEKQASKKGLKPVKKDALEDSNKTNDDSDIE